MGHIRKKERESGFFPTGNCPGGSAIIISRGAPKHWAGRGLGADLYSAEGRGKRKLKVVP